MKLPKEEYVKVEENGRIVTYCTMRQKALHTIGYNSSHVGRRLYTRHGKRYYKPFRNYFCGKDTDLDKLVDAGYMECCEKIAHGEKTKIYWFNRSGLDWLGEQIGVFIYDEERFICPVCENEELELGQNYCQICGEGLEWEEESEDESTDKER